MMKKYINTDAIVSAILFILGWVWYYFAVLDCIENGTKNFRPVMVFLIWGLVLFSACIVLLDADI